MTELLLSLSLLVLLVANQNVLLVTGELMHNKGSSGIDDVLAVDADFRQIMQQVRERKPQRFSYCLRREPHVRGQRRSVVRFDGEVRSARGMPNAQLLYNANHAADYGPYYVELVGVSVQGKMLQGIDAGTFRRNEAGKGGTVLDVGFPVIAMVQAAYDALEHAVEQKLRKFGLPRVSHSGFPFCLRGATGGLWEKLPAVVLHFRKPDAMIEIPPGELFASVGLDTCMTVVPRDMTIIGLLAQVHTRFTFDLGSGIVFFAKEKCELDTGH